MTVALLLSADVQNSRDELLDDLLDDYEIACQLRVRLDATPRWRWRRRANIDRALRHVCEQTDMARDALGATGRGEGLYELLDRIAGQREETSR